MRDCGYSLCMPSTKQVAYIREAPMRIGTEDPWALTELAKAGGLGAQRSPPSLGGGLGGTLHLGTFASRCLSL